MEVKNGQIWQHGAYQYLILEAEPHCVIGMTNPFAEPEKEGYFWQSSKEDFLKNFTFVRVFKKDETDN